MNLSVVDKALFLKQTALFEGLELDLLFPTADLTKPLVINKGSAVFSADQPPTRLLYFVYEGSIKILDAFSHQIALLEPPEFFGDESLFNASPYCYTALSLLPTTLLTLEKHALEAIAAQCPSVFTALLKAFAKKASFRKR